MNLLPAVDLLDGRVARLERGRRESAAVYEADPRAAVRRFAAAGARWLHVVDLNRAAGDGGSNLAAVRDVIEEAARGGMRTQVGGGLQEPADLDAVLACGAARVVVGTAAAVDGAAIQELLERYGSRIAVALDAREGEVVVRGRTEGSGRRVEELAAALAAAGVRRFVYTDVGRDGRLEGPDVAGAAALTQGTGRPVIASGGVGAVEHVAAARAARIEGLVVGRALWDGRVTIEAAVTAAGPQEAS